MAASSAAAEQSTEVDATAVSSLRATGGSSEALIETTLRSSPHVPGWMDRWRSVRTPAPGSRSPREHRSADPTRQAGGGETNLAPGGSELEMTTSCAVAAPLFRATSVQVNDVPGASAPGEAAAATVTSGVARRAPATDVVSASPTTVAPSVIAALRIRRDPACRTNLILPTLSRPDRCYTGPGGPARNPGGQPPACENASAVRTRCAALDLRGHTRSQANQGDATTSRSHRRAARTAGEPLAPMLTPLGDIMYIIGVGRIGRSRLPDRAPGAPRGPTGSPSKAPRRRSTARSSIRRAHAPGR